MESSGMIAVAIAVTGLGLSAVACLFAGYLIYKVRQVHETLYRTDYAVTKIAHNLSRNLSQNLQNLELLTHELRLDRPLPPLRGWVASPDILLVTARHILHAAPATIVECGSGASTVVLAQAAKLNGRGHVYAIDHDSAFAERTRELLARYGLTRWATIVYAPMRDMEIAGTLWEWYDPNRLPETPPIDLLFIDGPPAGIPKPLARYPAGPMLFPRLAPHGVVFADDTDRAGETKILQRWAREFPDLGQHTHDCEKGCVELRARLPQSEGVTPLRPSDRVLPQRRIPFS